jgi:hypothetical protein
MEPTVWIYFSKTGTGYELKGSDVISGFDAFINTDGTYMVEYAFSDMKNSMHFFIYEWDNSQKKRRTIFEGYQRENILVNFAKNVHVCHLVRQAIYKEYLMDSEELELEKNANS